MRRPARGQVFLGLFFLLYISNAVFSHYVGVEYLRTAREIKAAEQLGADPNTVEVSGGQRGRGGLLIFANAPLFITLGLIVRGEDPSAGLGYWAALLLGATYLPLFLSACLFFLVYAPSHPHTFPGVEWNDGTGPPEDD